MSTFLFLLILSTTTLITQADPIHLPVPNLPFGDINIVVLTDVHAWVAGHGRQEQWDADYGDVLSFYQRLKRYTNSVGHDLFLVSNGDWVHGTGMTPVPSPAQVEGSYLIPILQKMPWDAINCGNHELYDESIVREMTRPGGYIDWWGDRYLSANVNYLDDISGKLKPLGGQYKILEGFQSRVLIMGFLYDMDDACDIVTVDRVEEVVQQSWFKDLFRHDAPNMDAIVILGHFDLTDTLVSYLLTTIRQYVGEDMPVQFLTGHTHYRGYATMDPHSTSFEAGHYLDTVGFASIPSKNRIRQRQRVLLDGTEGNNTDPDDYPITQTLAPTPAPQQKEEERDRPEFFEYVFLDANKETLRNVLGTEKLETPDGSALSEFIYKTRDKLGLLDVIGCAPQSYFLNRSLTASDSLWGLFKDQVVPQVFDSHKNGESDVALLLSKNSFRYDLLANAEKKQLIRDDIVAVVPFNDTLIYLGDIPGNYISQVKKILDNPHDPYYDALPNYILAGNVTNNKDKEYGLFVANFDAVLVQSRLEELMGTSLSPKETDFTTLLLWESFVLEVWPCSGNGVLPDWFPKIDPDSFTNISDNDKLNRGLAFLLVGLVALFVCLCLVCICQSCRLICCSGGSSYITPDEMDAFALKLDDEGSDGADLNDPNNGLADMYSPSYDDEEEDHEML